MKFFCNKESLQNGINIVQKGVSAKTTLPILEGILVEAIENKIKLTSNDLEIGIECYIDASVTNTGSAVVESKMFGEIIRKLPNSEIYIEIENEGTFIIECEGSLYKLSSLNPDEFPRLPEIKVEESVIIKQNILREMIKQTIFAVSTDEKRPIFTGCMIEEIEDNINMVAVDGFRLSLRRHEYKSIENNFYAVIPGKTLNELLKILQPNDNNIVISISKNQALFEMEKCKIVSRLLDGEFLNYKSSIPVERETRIKVNRINLLSAFERVYLITREEKKYPVNVKIQENLLRIMCISTLGNAKEELNIENDGKDIEIGFNPKYFIDALKAITHEEVYIDFTTSMAPCVIRPLEGEEFVHMILPVRIREDI